MKEVLINAGFNYIGDCMICRNQYEDWTKYVNDKECLVKIKKDGRRAKIILEKKTYWLQLGAGPTPMDQKLKFFLEQHGITDRQTA
jgi:hypothetical protein